VRKGTRAGSPAKVAEEEIERQTGGNDMQILDHLTEAAALFMGLAVGMMAGWIGHLVGTLL